MDFFGCSTLTFERSAGVIANFEQRDTSKLISDTFIAQLQQQANDLKPEDIQERIKASQQLNAMQAGFTSQEMQAESNFIQLLEAEVELRKKASVVAGVEKGTASQKAYNEVMSDEARLQRIIAEGTDQHAQALIRLARTQADTVVAANKGGEDQTDNGKLEAQKAAVEAEKNDAISAAMAALAAKESTYDADVKAAGANASKKKELDAQWKNEQQATADQIVQITADANKQIVTLETEAANQKAAAMRAAAQAGYDDILRMAISAAQREEKLQEQSAKDLQALHRKTDAETLASEIQAVNNETNAEVSAYNSRIKNLDKFATDYEKKYKELQDKIREAEQQGDDQVTRLKQESLQKQMMLVVESENRMEEAIASDIAHSIVMNKSLAQAFRQTGEQMAEQAIKNVIMMELTGNKQKLINAKTAYGNAFAAMSGVPPSPMWGYAAGAAAFAAVMSFEIGGKIPGAGGPVPIIGHAGETVITKSLTDRVERAESWAGGKGGAAQHNWHFSPTVHAMDAEGVDRVLTKHNNLFVRHIGAQIRKMNK